jgi:hypothetical protein
MKRIFLILMLAQSLVLAASTGFASDITPGSKPKYGPRGNPRAAPLALAPDYFKSAGHPAPDFWSLIGYYVPQFNGAACSVASVAMVLNAARARLPLTADDQVISQQALLDRVDVENWKQRLSKDGYEGQHGMSLDQLARASEAALKSFGFKNASVKAVHVLNRLAQTQKEVVEDLKRNELSSKNFIIANFDQKQFTDDAQVGHFAPVGAFDAEKQRVLILDPDREYYEPYWVSVDTFLAGMATDDSASRNKRGYLLVSVE